MSRHLPVVFYTRQGCPLCDKGMVAARAVFGDSIAVVDIDLDLSLLAEYNDRVPVIATESGEVIAEGAIAPDDLRRITEGLAQP